MPSPHRQNSQTQSEVSPESRGTLTPLPLRPDVRNRWAQPGPAPTIPGAEPGEGALGSYLRAVRSHLVLVIAITVAAGIAAVAWDQLRTPSYQTSAQMLVTPISSACRWSATPATRRARCRRPPP